MSQKLNQDSHISYVDGVKVKISEKYKPPPKISIAMTYSQRILLNKKLQDNMPRYDFTREISIQEKMKELRSLKQTLAKNQRDKLERIKETRRKQMEERLDELKKDAAEECSPSDVGNLQNYTTGGVLIPTQVNSNILTPIPLTKQVHVCNEADKSPFNISDFDPDTSSPFDNMELTTINDIEELKQVLQNDGKNNTRPAQDYFKQQQQFYGYNVSNQPYVTNGYGYYQQDNPLYYYYNNGGTSAVDYNLPTPHTSSDESAFRSVPDIMKALETELKTTQLNTVSHKESSTSPKVEAKVESSTAIVETLHNPYDSLSKSLQDTCEKIASMGFSKAMVARACKDIGDDEKKILDHVLALSDLLDLGFSEGKVAVALLSCNNDKDKALDQLIS